MTRDVGGSPKARLPRWVEFEVPISEEDREGLQTALRRDRHDFVHAAVSETTASEVSNRYGSSAAAEVMSDPQTAKIVAKWTKTCSGKLVVYVPRETVEASESKEAA